MSILEPFKSDILSKYAAGTKCTALAREYNVVYGTMWLFLKANKAIFRRRLLSPEQELALVADYKAGMRHPQLAIKYGIERVSARNYTMRHGATKLPQYRVKNINGDFFKTLTPESLWVLGWFWSDGNVSKKSNGFNITVHSSDEAVLHTIKGLMDCDADSIYRSKRQLSSCFYGCHGSIHADLVSLGCIPNKSLVVEYPKMLAEDWQHWAFLRGVLEGDGHISLKSKTQNRPAFSCQIASGSPAFLNGLKKVLKDRLGIDSIIYGRYKGSKGKSIVSKLAIAGGKKNIIRFLDLLYENGNAKYYLDRKFKVYLEMKDVMTRPKEVVTAKGVEGYFLSPQGVVYHVKGIPSFARELGIGEHVFFHMIKMQDVRRNRFKSRKHGWSLATPDQISLARANGTLIEKSY